jgi:uncharacterized membrane protein
MKPNNTLHVVTMFVSAVAFLALFAATLFFAVDWNMRNAWLCAGGMLGALVIFVVAMAGGGRDDNN